MLALSPANSGVKRKPIQLAQRALDDRARGAQQEGVVLRQRIVVHVKATIPLNQAAQADLVVAVSRLERGALVIDRDHRSLFGLGHGFFLLQFQPALDHLQALVQVGQADFTAFLRGDAGAEPAFQRLQALLQFFHGRRGLRERRQGQRTQQRDRQPRHPPSFCRHARSLSAHCRFPRMAVRPEPTMLRMHMHSGK